jgi:hypothetical protein
MRSFENSAFFLIYRTPFQRMHINPELSTRGWVSAELQRELNGRFGLDIWRVGVGKVLTVIWNKDDGPKTVVRFKRGDWEEALLTNAQVNSNQ